MIGIGPELAFRAQLLIQPLRELTKPFRGLAQITVLCSQPLQLFEHIVLMHIRLTEHLVYASRFVSVQVPGERVYSGTTP